MTDQWVQLDAGELAVNLALARSVQDISVSRDEPQVVVCWGGGVSSIYHGDEARRLMAWLKLRHLPVLLPSLPE